MQICGEDSHFSASSLVRYSLSHFSQINFDLSTTLICVSYSFLVSVLTNFNSFSIACFFNAINPENCKIQQVKWINPHTTTWFQRQLIRILMLYTPPKFPTANTLDFFPFLKRFCPIRIFKFNHHSISFLFFFHLYLIL